MREARLIVEYEGSKRKLCKIFFSKRDASIYVQPYWSASSYFSGTKEYSTGQNSITFNFRDNGHETAVCPKLSYHESGYVHLKVGKNVLVKIEAAPIGTIQGEEAHILTLLVDDLGKLPLLSSDLRWKKSKKDLVYIAKNSGKSARVLVYALSGKADQLDSCPLTFHLRRPSASQVTTFGVRVVGQTPVGDGQLVMLSGWHPDAANVDNPAEFIYLASNP